MSRETPSALRAMAHPLRLRMLSLLTGVPLSATEVAAELEVAHATASYHLRALHAAGLLVVEPQEEGAEGRRPGRPAVRYRHVPAAPAGRDRDPDASTMTFEAMVEDLRRRHGAMTRRRLVADGEAWLDRDTWEEVCALAERITALVHGEARAPRTPGTVHVSVTTAAFEL